MKRKGISLPIDMLVILAIAVIILIAIVAVFMGVWSPFATNQQGRANFNKACQILVNTGCNGDPSSSLCDAAKGIVLVADDATPCGDADEKILVKVGCGCPGVAPSGVPSSGSPVGSSAKLKSGDTCTGDSQCESGDCVTSPPNPTGKSISQCV